MAQKIASLYAEIGADTSGLTKGLAGARQQLGGAAQEMDRAGRAAQLMGGALKAGAVAGLGALSAALITSIKNSAEFESSFGKIKGLTNTAAGDIDKLKTSVLSMSRDLPVSANELAQGLYFISSSGYQGAEALKILEMSGKAAAAGLGETKTIADAVTSALNAYGLQGKDAARITDLLTKAVIEGKGEPAELAGSLGRVLPVAAAAGVNMEQVAAAMAVMTRTGMSAEEAATALRGTIGSLLAPAKQSVDALAALGLTTDDVAARLKSGDGLVGVLRLLMERTGGNVEMLDAIIPNIRALTGVLSLAGEQGAEYARVLGEMENAAGATDKAFNAMADTFEFKLKKAQNSVENLGIAIGNKLLPGLGQAADAATTLITWQDKMQEAFTGTEQKIRSSAATYEEYRSATLGIGRAAGLVNDVFRMGQGPVIEYAAGFKMLTEEQWNYGRTVEQALSIAAKSGLDLRNEYAGLAAAQQGVTDGAGKLAESQTGVRAATDLVKEGMQELTAEFIFQKAAQDMDAEAALALGLKMGVLNAETVQATQRIAELKTQYDLNRDGVISAQEATKGYTQAIYDLGSGIGSTKSAIQEFGDQLEQLPREIVIAIRTELSGISIDEMRDIKNLPSSGTTAPKKTTPATPAKTPTRSGRGGTQAASGLNMIIPPGYPNDSYRINVTSGEHVLVTPRGMLPRQADGGAGSVVTIMAPINITESQQPVNTAEAISRYLGGLLDQRIRTT